jgi:hypothetical protein
MISRVENERFNSNQRKNQIAVTNNQLSQRDRTSCLTKSRRRNGCYPVIYRQMKKHKMKKIREQKRRNKR